MTAAEMEAKADAAVYRQIAMLALRIAERLLAEVKELRGDG